MKLRTWRRITMRKRWHRFTLEWWARPDGGEWALHSAMANPSMGQFPPGVKIPPDIGFRGHIDGARIRRKE